MPNNYQWPEGARLAMSVVVNVEEGSEYTVKDGDKGMEPVDELMVHLKKPMRNYGNESNYQYGINEGGPRIIKLLDEYDIRATWTAAAVSLERAPYLAEAIARRDDETCSHGYRWIHQFRMDETEERQFIKNAVTSIEKTTGKRPLGWLSRYLLTENTRRLLQEEGFLYHMDDYSSDAPFWDTVNGSDEPMVIVPYALDSNDMKMWVAPSYTPEAWLKYAKDTFDVLYEEGAEQPRMMSIGLHLRIIGRPGRIWALKEFFEYIKSKPGVWFATRQDIAEHFQANVAKTDDSTKAVK
ncbi:polysaccharide deacetylase family protein [Psychrosphaera sp. F3M07]|uniref:polysaccharide deacetylase family protein n=1 Tax=Psychrosphaera sp. F3M07 TaxID=2841560 RepID=UPI001C0A2F0C|nr:polysaccharide deacetylase family protein [Psychrosphaera sp. F3M07]MBU2919617.1 polysaccharide deacetylase family protein [Psychrosphaera sp. F3M07]